jgi:ATP-dependent Clp protease ATP-binding subunit ClpX
MASIPPKGGRKHPQQDFIKVDTNNILFICGGTFNGLEKIIGSRLGSKSMGFEADIQNNQDRNLDEIRAMAQPEDLIKFGLIPEFVGRLPIVASLDNLGLEALIQILTEPKNSLVKQYHKLFELEGVRLKFTNEALHAIAKNAIPRKSGARGLRAIMETIMLDIMYDIPSLNNVRECVIGEDVITRNESPLLLYENQAGYA